MWKFPLGPTGGFKIRIDMAVFVHTSVFFFIWIDESGSYQAVSPTLLYQIIYHVGVPLWRRYLIIKLFDRSANASRASLWSIADYLWLTYGRSHHTISIWTKTLQLLLQLLSISASFRNPCHLDVRSLNKILVRGKREPGSPFYENHCP